MITVITVLSLSTDQALRELPTAGQSSMAPVSLVTNLRALQAVTKLGMSGNSSTGISWRGRGRGSLCWLISQGIEQSLAFLLAGPESSESLKPEAR